MLEKKMQQLFTQSIHYNMKEFMKSEKYLYHKLSDLSMDMKPSDCFLITEKKVFLFELKVCKNKNKISPFKLLQGIQHSSLKKVHNPAENHYSYIVIRLENHKLNNKRVIIFIPADIEDKQYNILELIEKYSVDYTYDSMMRTNRLNLYQLIK